MKTRAQRQMFETRLTAEAPPPLSPARAFVVQFREQTVGTGTPFAGRVEHMISGRAARFESSEELLTFFVRVLSAMQTTLSEEG